jgi:hypothetical protein
MLMEAIDRGGQRARAALDSLSYSFTTLIVLAHVGNFFVVVPSYRGASRPRYGPEDWIDLPYWKWTARMRSNVASPAATNAAAASDP